MVWYTVISTSLKENEENMDKIQVRGNPRYLLFYVVFYKKMKKSDAMS